MGNLLSGLWNSLFGEKETRVLILGLVSAGKTTILYRLHCGEVLTTTPSLQCHITQGMRVIGFTGCLFFDAFAPTAIGFNMEVVEYKNIKFNVWDLGGQDSIVCHHHDCHTFSSH